MPKKKKRLYTVEYERYEEYVGPKPAYYLYSQRMRNGMPFEEAIQPVLYKQGRKRLSKEQVLEKIEELKLRLVEPNQ